jgi:hypothetical protein
MSDRSSAPWLRFVWSCRECPDPAARRRVKRSVYLRPKGARGQEQAEEATGDPASRVDRRSPVRPRLGKAGLLELQSQWVRSVTAGKDADTRLPVSGGGVRVACGIFRQDPPGNEQGQGRNGDPQRGADQTDNHAIASRQEGPGRQSPRSRREPKGGRTQGFNKKGVTRMSSSALLWLEALRQCNTDPNWLTGSDRDTK